MPVRINVTSISPFHSHSEQNSVAHRLEKGLKSFLIFSDAAGCKNDKQKGQLLFIWETPRVESVLHPEKIQVIQSAIFRQEKQKEGETITQFVTRLQQLAILCDFPEESIDSLSKVKLLTMGLSLRRFSLHRYAVTLLSCYAFYQQQPISYMNKH